MLNIRHLNKKYYVKSEKTFELCDISFDIPDNSLTFILGKSGCGKTTLLNLIGCIDKPDDGLIVLDGQNITELKEKDLVQIRNKHIGFVFQDFNLIDDLDVYDNICLSFTLKGEKPNEGYIDSILQKLGIFSHKRRKISELSGGQKQRVAIARALIKKPKILICDEPTGALDSETSKDIFELLKSLTKECSILVVTHDEEYASEYGNQIIRLKDGRQENSNLSLTDDFAFNKKREPIKKPSFSFFTKMAAKNLKAKKGRFAIAATISVLSASIIGLAFAIATLNEEKIIFDALCTNNINYLDIIELDSEKFGNEYRDDFAYINPNMKEELEKNIDCETFPIYKNFQSMDESFIRNNFDDYYLPNLNGFFEVDNSLIEKLSIELVLGNLPKNDNEICLSQYLCDYFCELGYESSIDKKEISSYEQLLDKEICIKDVNKITNKYKIVGVIDTKMPYEFNNKTDLNTKLYQYEIYYGIHNCIFTNKGFYDRNYKNNDALIQNDSNFSFSIFNNSGFRKSFERINTLESQKEIYKFDCDNTNNDGEIYLPLRSFYNKNFDEVYGSEIISYVYSNFNDIKTNDGFMWSSISDYVAYLEETGFNDLKFLNEDSEFFKEKAILKIQNDIDFEHSLNTLFIANESALPPFNLNVEVSFAGFFDDLSYPDTAYADNRCFEKIKETYGNRINDIRSLIVPLSKDVNKNVILAKKIKETNIKRDNNFVRWSTFNYSNSIIESFNEETKLLSSMKTVFGLGALIFFSISAFFSYFYFSGLIIDKTKQIGILKCLGLSNRNAIKLFALFALFVFASIFSISLLAYFGICNFANSAFSTIGIVKFNFISFNFSSIGVIAGSLIFGLLLGLVVPFIRIYKMKPVEILKSND